MKYAGIVEPAAARYRVPASWVYAVIGAESGSLSTFTFRDLDGPTWEGSVNQFSWGPMQILESTAREMGYSGAAADLARPEVSIPLGAKYIRTIIDRHKLTDFRAMYSAYNSGSPSRWKTSAQVAANVDRALQWLKHFAPRPALGAAAAVLVLVMGAGFLLSRRS